MRKFRSLLPILLLPLAPLAAQAPDSLPAFPGAEGYGAYTAGGRGGRVIHVTNLATSGPGSLNWAVQQEGPRIVVFDTSGVIPGAVEITHGRLTIMGQTAPGAGITIKGMLTTRWVEQGDIRYDDLVVRFLRIRPDHIPNVSWFDGIQFSRVRRGILDHISVSWASDEVVDIYSSTGELSVQWCAIEEAATEGHSDGGSHAYALITGPETDRVSIHHNLFAHNARRCPALGEGPADVRGNVMYDFRDGLSHEGHVPDTKQFNLVGNYYKRGPADGSIFPFCFSDSASYYLRDNFIFGTGLIQDPWAEADKHPGLAYYRNLGNKAPAEFPMPAVATTLPEQNLETVLGAAGCIPRDTVARRAVNEVRAGTGRWGRRDVPDLMAGLTVLPAPRDTDRDGMPDFWERSRGLDPADSTDSRKILASGYTAVEEYCHLLARRLIETGGEPILRGDLDNNMQVNIFDLLTLLRELAAGGHSWRRDLNLDLKSDIFDLLELLRLLSGN